jgi:hypothetical protein
MINTNSYICEIQDINHVAFLTAIKGYEINEVRKKIDEKTGKEITIFVFYDNRNVINLDLCEYLNAIVQNLFKQGILFSLLFGKQSLSARKNL